ncbi:glycosyl hydrolase 115 family protein [Chryseobacterium geocarposphaerae]|uniref:Glycosyl hydrolase family 115 (Putative glucuronidase) n=1 Tax=Chryseobacterium geocarposphaerae TaxID=1416776 RepID=A0A2M9C6T7_9FLAO|nr:glycosyl hydrolase 115 family protein [Chryseobacterium geocarposphaerae]PJJ66522.1 glycosyl hydrolase family 115 (putative glucuronidase) [Chryseobacterium geocarposphaerae]
MNFTKSISLFLTLLFIFFVKAADPFISFAKTANSVVLKERNSGLMLFSDSDSDKGILRAVANLQSDFQKVTGVQPSLISQSSGANGMLIIIGEVGKSKTIDALIKTKKIDGNSIKGKNEKFIIQNISNPFPGVSEAIVIAGSDKRGTIYGIYEMSQQIGVSPWYYWADVPVEKKENLYFKKGIYTDGEPAVEYRGIFLNDEEPSLGGWARATFGGINSKFYEKVFELILRMKGNYIWPAMWGKAFYDDDVLNGPLANEMGIVMGTSHHEPMAQAQTDWHRYIKKNNLPNVWDYSKNEKVLQEFWKLGLERSKNWEKLVTVGMRGDGDEAMGEGTNISLLEKIVKDQRKIIADVTGKKAEKTPQVWALYKEVQDYYDKGMRVPDDVILLFCDDNWGNVRKLPDLSKPLHKGGYGMYYHFDYVGGPRNSKWINISPIQRVWEQMNLSYEHKVDKVWVVNVGDLKPMEFPISFFLDMAWNPKQFNSKNLLKYTEKWAAQQFGEKYAKEIARMINLYSKYNRRVTPETLNSKTFSLENYHEFETVLNDYRSLAIDALHLKEQIPAEYQDAYYQLVLYPIDACSNLYEMYYAVAKNRELAAKYDLKANYYADRVKECFERNAYLDYKYNHEIAGGKWQHMMDQMKIGYKTWADGKENIMPEVTYVYDDNASKEKVFQEKNGYVSIEAENFARNNNSDRIHWEVIPDFGKTKSGVTTFPQNAYPKADENIYLEYDMNFESKGEFEVQLLLAPTLNFNHNKGLRYEISFDGGTPQVVNFNGHYKGELGRWQSEHIIKSTTKHQISQPGKHTLRFRVLEPGIVLEKILINTGGLQPTYLGAPESEILH